MQLNHEKCTDATSFFRGHYLNSANNAIDGFAIW